MNKVPLGELMPSRAPSLNPASFPNEDFELWSIPAFDSGQPEWLAGSEIGSAKKCVEPEDVLLSRIVPHIRRSWVVGPNNGARQIASGEWIIFRGSRFFPPYLRHVLISNDFHACFMQTVAGVGGSLLRARPEGVKEIEIPLPSLPEQKRIAAILDQADSLRRLRQRAIDRLNSLGQAIFAEMFGDPASNPKRWGSAELGALITAGPQNGLYKPSSMYGEGAPILRIDAFYDGRVTKLDDLKRLSVNGEELTVYGLRPNDIVVNRVNSTEYLGKSAIIPSLAEPTVFESNIMRFRVDEEQIDPRYLISYLQTPFLKAQVRRRTKDAVNQSSINQQDVKSFVVRIPPLDLQLRFVERIQVSERLAHTLGAGFDKAALLFSALQHRAFHGEL